MYAPISSAAVGACNLLHNDFDYIEHSAACVGKGTSSARLIRWVLMAGGQEVGVGVVAGVNIIVRLNPGYEARVQAHELIS
jgi:hypothetical protein